MKAVIRATGVVFPGGTGAGALLEAHRAGRALARPSRHLDGAAAAEMDASLKSLVPRKGLASLSRAALLAAAAIESLRADCGDAVLDSEPDRCALVVGTAYGHVESKAEFHRSARQEGARLVSPIVFPNTIINSLAGHAAILNRWTGPNSTVTSGHRSGLEAILRAVTLLDAGRADRAVVLGCEEVTPTLLRATRATGGALGEAAAAILLEPAGAGGGSSAVRGRLLGSAERSSVRGDPGATMRDAVRDALADAGLEPSSVGCVIEGAAEGAGPEAGAALRGALPPGVPRHCVSSVCGDTRGASGALAVVLACAGHTAGALEVPALVVSCDAEGAIAAVVG